MSETASGRRPSLRLSVVVAACLLVEAVVAKEVLDSGSLLLAVLYTV